MKRIVLTLTVCLLAAPGVTLAQDTQDQEQPRRERRGGGRGDGQDARGRGGRGDGEGRGRGGPGFGPGGMQRMAERLAEQLNLDETQKLQLDEIIANNQKEMQDARARWQEVREAEEAGDTELARQIRTELQGQMRNPMSGLMDDIEGILREDQMQAFEEIRERFDRGGRERGQISEIPERLKLTPEQRELFDEVRRQQGEQMRQRFGEMRPLFEELRQARDDGNEARAQEVEAQLEAMRGGPDGGLEHILAELEPTLSDEQKALLAQFREEMGSRERDRRRGDREDPRRIVQMAKRLDGLTEEQKTELNEIEQAAGREARRARGDREAAAALAESVKQQIIDILTDEQALKFDEMLKQSDRPGREGGRRPGREGRRGRGGNDNP